MPDLRAAWTKTRPETAGWYWCHSGMAECEPELVQVRKTSKGLSCQSAPLTEWHPDWYWMPIATPDHPNQTHPADGAEPIDPFAQLIDGLRLDWNKFNFASTPFGSWQVESRNDGTFRCGWYGATLVPCDSIDDGKAKCEHDYHQRVRAIFDNQLKGT